MRDGHEGVVKILLERGDVNHNKPGNLGKTVLSRGAQDGHEGVVKMLLGSGDVNCDKTDIDAKTPPLWAVENGHEEVVKMLLRCGNVDPNRKGRSTTPLSLAAVSGREGVVRVLL